ncbi:MAG: hypothetical protein A3E83_05245 [Gammaproteobacteria bacterium RIFCSPHIGHO2_12_FULL_41_20]|nr:MAG: hypothetical protein A3E83_05245 [Gammaproteobacteria bacterium RIFCSPHIGHO2_12_FULL_41_20]
MNKLTSLVKGEAYRIVYWQLAMVVILAVVSLLITGLQNGLSVLAGGVVYVLPNIVFVWRVFNYVGARQVERFIFAFFIGEMAKLIISAVLFILVVNHFTINVVWALGGYVGATFAFWIACFMCLSRAQGAIR